MKREHDQVSTVEIMLGLGWTDDAEIADRLHQIVDGTGDGPFLQKSGYQWQLDSANNWWADVREAGVEGRSLVVAHRYGHADKVQTWLEYVFGG